MVKTGIMIFFSLNKTSSFIEEYQEPTGYWEGVRGLGFLLTALFVIYQKLTKSFHPPIHAKPHNCIIDNSTTFFPSNFLNLLSKSLATSTGFINKVLLFG